MTQNNCWRKAAVIKKKKKLMSRNFEFFVQKKIVRSNGRRDDGGREGEVLTIIEPMFTLTRWRETHLRLLCIDSSGNRPRLACSSLRASA